MVNMVNFMCFHHNLKRIHAAFPLHFGYSKSPIQHFDIKTKQVFERFFFLLKMKTLELNCFEDSRRIEKYLKPLLVKNFVILSMYDFFIAGRILTFFMNGMRGMLTWLRNRSLLAKEGQITRQS